MTMAFRSACRALLQACGGAMVLGLPVHAVQLDEQRLERVEVTGSAIGRIDAESALPVRLITEADIRKSGATSLADLLQKLSFVQGFANDAAAVGGGTGGFASVSLHGLGATRTLVLINGRRVASFAAQTLVGESAGVDLGSIPLAAIQRIEVLTDGASALYGSDAMAGVVNLITRQDFAGLELAAGTVVAEGGGAREKTASITAGYGGLESDGFNVLFTASHEDRASLKALDRSGFAWPSRGYYEFDSTDGHRYRLYTTSSRSAPGAVVGGVTATQSWGDFTPYLLANGDCPNNAIASGKVCRYIYPADLEIIPEATRDSLLSRFAVGLGAGARFFAEAMYSRHELVTRIAPPPGVVSVKAGSSLYAQYLEPYGVPPDVDVLASWRIVDAGSRTMQDISEATRLVSGLKGFFAGWDYEISVAHSVNRWVETLEGGYLYNERLATAMNSGLINPFVGVGQQSPEAMALLDAAKLPAGYQYKLGTSYLDSFQLQASREIFLLPAGGVQFGSGFDVHRERNKYEPSLLAQGLELGGEFPDNATDAPFDVARTAWGVFGEFLVPLAKGVETTAALRYDRYSDFGDTTNFKIGARWNPLPSLMFRASVNSGFHAPQPAQMSSVTQYYGVTGGRYSCPFAPTDSRSAYCISGGATEYPLYVSGNPDLRPEKSMQYTAGVRFEPASWASLGADYWRVRIRDQFGSKTEYALARDWDDSIAKGYIRPLYVSPLTGLLQYAFVLPQDNLGDRNVAGVDFDLRFALRTALGRLSSVIAATWTLVDERQTERGGPFYSSLGRLDPAVGWPTLRVQGVWRTSLATGSFEHMLTLNYKAGYDEQNFGNLDVTDSSGNRLQDGFFAAPHRVKAWFPVDWQTAWSTPVKGLRLAGGVTNLFDKNPPFAIAAGSGQIVAYNPQISDPRGRTCYLNASYRFL
ncbi:TonB-dependent receptor plug domain-containing protein [Niveibacterium terrae]|uniref:TonB-dependent receptor plug domain-containing protein n=1 Tax=Niveibacterium terrae TaxID=3373598 RepID=UPI003A916DC8